MAWAAITKTFAVARSSLPSGRLIVSAATRPSAAISTNDTTASAITSAPARSACATWLVASYLACTGQIGMQLLLPQQTGRLSYGCEFLACGVGCTRYGDRARAAAVRRSA